MPRNHKEYHVAEDKVDFKTLQTWHFVHAINPRTGKLERGRITDEWEIETTGGTKKGYLIDFHKTPY